MVDRKVILTAYKKGPEAVISVLVQRKDTFPRNNEDSYWNHSLRC
ncbi:hypothetical protein [Bacillus sp. FSL K6-0268]